MKLIVGMFFGGLKKLRFCFSSNVECHNDFLVLEKSLFFTILFSHKNRNSTLMIDLKIGCCRNGCGAKVVNSREVREVVEGSTCISDIKLSEIC